MSEFEVAALMIWCFLCGIATGAGFLMAHRGP